VPTLHCVAMMMRLVSFGSFGDTANQDTDLLLTAQSSVSPYCSHAHPTRSEYLGGGIPAFASFIDNACPLDPTAFHSPIGTNIFGPTSGSISCLWLYNSSLALEALIFNQHMTPPATMRKPMMAMMATR